MKLRWGIIGCGGIADRRTLPGMMLSKTSECYAVMDTNPDAANACKEKYGAKFATTDYNDILNCNEVDAVYIGSPVFCHKEQAMAAAKAKKHILIEKPVGFTADETLEISEFCKKQGVKLGIGFMMRFHSYHQAIKKLIEEGEIGEIVTMRAQFSGWYPEIEGAWRQTKSLSGGGTLIDMGVHAIDLLQYISGLECVECTGFANTVTFKYEVDDTAAVIMKMNNGALACVQSNFNVPNSASSNPLEFYGTKGSIIAVGTLNQIEQGTVKVIPNTDDGSYNALHSGKTSEPYELKVDFGNMYTKEIDAFANAIINDTEPPVNVDNTITVQKIVDAVYNSKGAKF